MPATTTFLPLSAWGLGVDRPLLVAGPCSAESADQVLATARAIRTRAPQVKVFRAGVWKPRTRPGTFEGNGAEALRWLQEVKAETGLLLATEVANAEHVDASLKAGIDLLWIGARTTPSPFAVQEIADALRGVDVPVLVKNPINPDLQLWIGALERLAHAGLTRLAAIHRGFHWFERTPYRNSPMWEFPIRLKGTFPDLELLCDPSHIAGGRERLGEVAQQALDLNFSGLMVETHIRPDQALSDADQQVDPAGLAVLLEGLNFRRAAPPGVLHAPLQELRDLIDQLDEELAQKLGSRMAIAERIGEYKHAHNVAILQPERWEAIMRRQLQLARHLGLSPAFVEAVMNAIHTESIRRQSQVADEAGQGVPPSGSRASAQD
ncbi:MAG: bifunctional 3-deoxy-7-phosphoheptulonate synthase/chorismate mutase type II [Flavobacteriales bacterium]|nr:bifunctional 3-deoxy-7-phosphoheptulonate synthase/chorismate mutase type II [Flavobacteriales bacterium]